MSIPTAIHKPAGTPDGGQFAPSARTDVGTDVLDGSDQPSIDQAAAAAAGDEVRLNGLTAAEHRAYGTQRRKDSLDSFDRSDTDGFATQAAGDLMSSVHQAQAEICDNGGKIEVDALFDRDGNMIPAKRLQTRYGMSWALLENDDPNSEITGWFNESEAQDDTRRVATNAKKGFFVGKVRAPGNARLGGGGHGFSGMASVYVQTYRTDGGFARDVEVVDNGTTPKDAT